MSSRRQAQQDGRRKKWARIWSESPAARTPCHTMIADGVSAPPVAPLTDADTARIAVVPLPTGETGKYSGGRWTTPAKPGDAEPPAGHARDTGCKWWRNGPDALTLLRQQAYRPGAAGCAHAAE